MQHLSPVSQNVTEEPSPCHTLCILIAGALGIGYAYQEGKAYYGQDEAACADMFDHGVVGLKEKH